ncbi:MAG TPA: transposase [Ktedonobacterales bacterium]
MLTLPDDMFALLASFAPLFSRRVWRYVPILVVGAILAPGRRMVSTVLRSVGLGQTRRIQNYHRALSRAVWSSRRASRILLGLLVATFAPTGPLVLGIDETIERRRGAKIAAAGIYRDPVRSSRSHFVKVNGLRWISLMLLVPIPWAGRVWALPFLTALAPSERYAQARGRRHKPITLWARQLVRQVHRWLPKRLLVLVADSSYAALDLLAAVRPVATVVTRLRLDAQLFAPAPPRLPHQKGRPRLVGPRLPTLEQRAPDPATAWTSLTVAQWYGRAEHLVDVSSQTAVWYHTGLPPVPIRWVLIRDPKGKFATQALLCTDLDATPLQTLSWFVLRWQLEVTFQAVRTHLGVETQRHWSERAIARTTPALLGLFSLVTLLAHEPMTRSPAPLQQTAWYTKTTPTFSDALALVRRRLWTQATFPPSPCDAEIEKVPRALLDHLAGLLCYAA